MKESSHFSKNNTELCAEDMSRATRRQKIDWLMQIIDNELDRGEEADEQLVWECMALLEQLSPKDTVTAVPLPPHHTVRKARHKRFEKTIMRLTTAAAVVLMVTLLSVYAHAQSMVRQDQQVLSDALSYAKSAEQSEADQADDLDPNAPKQETFTRMTDLFSAYPTLDFYYPRQNSNYPDHLRTDIKQASVTYHSDESWVVVLGFDHSSLISYTVQRQVSSAKYTPPDKDPQIIHAQYSSFPVSEIATESGTVYETGFTVMGLCYTVQALDIDTLRRALGSIWSVQENYSTVEELEANWGHLWGFRLPDRMPKDYTLTRITVHHESNAEWKITFYFHSESGYQASCYVERKFDGSVVSGVHRHTDPNLRWTTFNKNVN